MGKLSGVNANLITKVSGVPVANISKVGPILASSIGLGGGGGTAKVFAQDSWSEPSSACTNGQKAIDKNGSMTIYKNGDYFYTDSGLETPFNGKGSWWWSQTDNIAYAIGENGDLKGPPQTCTVSNTLKEFANFVWDNTESICFQGPEIINEMAVITLYYNAGENRLYTDEVGTSSFMGNGGFYYNVTDNSWAQVGGEGYLGAAGGC
jgi:hypothetical protein